MTKTPTAMNDDSAVDERGPLLPAGQAAPYGRPARPEAGVSSPTAVDELLQEILEKRPEPAAPDVDEEDETDLDKLKQRTPPKDGLCRRCGQDKPINRLMLCYVCWVKTNLEDSGWTEGQAHPAWCACSVPGAHPGLRSTGN